MVLWRLGLQQLDLKLSLLEIGAVGRFGEIQNLKVSCRPIPARRNKVVSFIRCANTHFNFVALIQLMAASEAGRDVFYLTFRDVQLSTELTDLHKFLQKKHACVCTESLLPQ